MTEITTNPLAMAPKREKAGATTFKKFLYQYHWAFCRLLEEHATNNEYALFIEEHEDVTIADSLNETKSRFEFNQIKNVKNKFTISKLIRKTKNDSILTKMANSIHGKIESNRVKCINLVSTGGFQFKSHKKGFNYEVITAGTLDASEINAIKNHLEAEVGDASLINNLAFIIPSLSPTDFENAIKGRISCLLNSLSNGQYYNSEIVYNCIINDLYNKGINNYDYSNWNDALKKKAITREQVQNVFNSNINRKPDQQITTELNHILDTEYNLKSIRRKSIMQAFQRYYVKCLHSTDLATMNISEEISKLIKQNQSLCTNALELEQTVKQHLSTKTAEYFQDDIDFTGAFLYEFLR